MIGCLLHSADFDMFYSSGCDGLFKAFRDCFLTHVCQLIFRVITRIACCQQYFRLCPFLFDFLHSFLYSMFRMSTVVSIAVCRFCCISLNSLCVGLWLLRDDLPEFGKLILNVAQADALFSEWLPSVALLAFLAHWFDAVNYAAYELQRAIFLIALDDRLRKNASDFSQHLDEVFGG